MRDGRRCAAATMRVVGVPMPYGGNSDAIILIPPFTIFRQIFQPDSKKSNPLNS